jgi:RHS repeat-associated protein
VRMKFTGKERDSETGWDYFGARYMSSVQGRFTSADKPFADQDPVDPQSWNLYSYTRNNPLRYIDANGEAVVDAGKVRIGTVAFKYYKRESLLDLGAILSTFWPVQQGSLRDFKQNQSSHWYPTQNNAEGGCTVGCGTTYSEQGVGVRILPQTDRQSPRKAIRVLPAKRSGFSFESDQRSPLQAITLGLSGPPVIGKGER